MTARKPQHQRDDQFELERRRALALELAIKAAPLCLGAGQSSIGGAALLKEAEQIEDWLKAAGSTEPNTEKQSV